MTSAKPELPDYLGNIRIILTRTSHPANIGSAARAMKPWGCTTSPLSPRI